MSQSLTLRPIARIHTEFSEKFGIPRQSGLVEELSARIVLGTVGITGQNSELLNCGLWFRL